MMVKTDLIRALGLASATFPNFPTTEAMIESYWLLLADLDVSGEELVQAIARVLKSQPFFPTVHAIRKEIISEAFILAPSNALVWKEILDKRDERKERVRHLERLPNGTDEWVLYRESEDWRQAFNPQWSHPAIANTIATLGGWNDVYTALEENKGIATYRSQLWKIYEDYASTADRLTYLGESSNRKELQ